MVSHAHHARVPLFMRHTVLSQSVFTPTPILFSSDWNLCLALNLHVVLLIVTIYLAQPEWIPSRSLFYYSLP